MSGIFAVYSRKKKGIMDSLFYGLTALQHRGESEAGIAIVKDEILIKKGAALVYYLLKDELNFLKAITPYVGIGHVLYEESSEVQPTKTKMDKYEISLAMDGVILGFAGKDDLVAREIFSRALREKGNIYAASLKLMEELEGHGSYNLVILLKKENDVQLVAIRDPQGIKPLCLGKKGDEYLISSESKGLDGAGAKFIRDVEPGEVIIISQKGLEGKVLKRVAHAHCCFEWVYFADPTSIIEGKNVYLVRKKLGRMLARKYPLKVDMVIASPDSGRGVAIGYAQELKKPFEEAVVKNPGAKRTFQVEDPEERKKAAKSKFFINQDIIKGKKVALGDDSIVRGTVVKEGTISKLKASGVSQVHGIISCPPLCYPCFKNLGAKNYAAYGLYGMPAEEIGRRVAKKLGADSICYPSIKMLEEAIGHKDLCMACLNGQYPLRKKAHRKIGVCP